MKEQPSQSEQLRERAAAFLASAEQASRFGDFREVDAFLYRIKSLEAQAALEFVRRVALAKLGDDHAELIRDAAALYTTITGEPPDHAEPEK